MSLSHARSHQETSPALFARQRQLLALLDAVGGRAGNLDFQKLLFLYCQEPEAAGAYEFVPYKFGAFSFTSWEKTAYTMAQRGELPGFKVGGQWRFKRADIDRWIEEQKAGAGGKREDDPDVR